MVIGGLFNGIFSFTLITRFNGFILMGKTHAVLSHWRGLVFVARLLFLK